MRGAGWGRCRNAVRLEQSSRRTRAHGLGDKGGFHASAGLEVGSAELLRAIRRQLLTSGVPAVTDIAVEGKRLMTRDRRLAITAEVREYAEGNLHGHVTCWLPNASAPDGKDALHACVPGSGATLTEAAERAAAIWLRLVGAPVLACLAAQPVLDADHFEGSEPWEIPGGHGFVGPFAVRGARGAIDLEQVAQGDAFRFAGYPRDGRPHLAKATLLGQNSRWTRHLENDGHASLHADEDWRLGVAAPMGPVLCTRFAVFFMAEAVGTG